MQKTFYEQQALECRKLASEIQDLTHKKQMEDMAEVWEELAQQQSQQTNRSRSLGFFD
jgi:hypothetical protein